MTTFLRSSTRKSDKRVRSAIKLKPKGTGLNIRSTSEGFEGDETRIVKFVVKHKTGDKTEIHHERSNFSTGRRAPGMLSWRNQFRSIATHCH